MRADGTHGGLWGPMDPIGRRGPWAGSGGRADLINGHLLINRTPRVMSYRHCLPIHRLAARDRHVFAALMLAHGHGDGLVTRYAHNQENLVDVGDLVRRGDVIAFMGSSGRSTGPHVHFEVFKHGRAVDPATYVRRTHR